MVVVQSVSGRRIQNSYKEDTILVSINTNVGEFSASSPTGKSAGKHEEKPYKKDLDGDIETLEKFSEYFSNEKIEKFDDLRRVEDIADGHLGSNTTFALESAILKALAKEQKKEIWRLINPEASKFPRLVGNCIGGGMHSETKEKKPDFQEFLVIPETENVEDAFRILKDTHSLTEGILKREDKNFESKKDGEEAWITSLMDKEIFDILDRLKIPFGTDVAASTFFVRKKYIYKNPIFRRTDEEHYFYISNMIKNYNLFYVEDPFGEEDFKSFAKLHEEFPGLLLVGDDLTATSYKRLNQAIKEKSINGVSIKPNQIGRLSEAKRVVELAKENGIKIVFSHRNGETEEDILADLAFGFQADFLKCGITGKEREVKIKRMIEIQKSLKKTI